MKGMCEGETRLYLQKPLSHHLTRPVTGPHDCPMCLRHEAT